MSGTRGARCRAQITDRASDTPRRCRNPAPNPNGYCFRHQLEARIGAARAARQRQQLDAERRVYERIIGPYGLSATDPAVQTYDLTDHLELFMTDEVIVKITVEVSLP